MNEQRIAFPNRWFCRVYLSNGNGVIFRLLILTCWFLAACGISHAQRFSFGIVAGGSITSGFPNETIVTPPTSQAPEPAYAFHSSDAGNYLIGAMAEIRLPLNMAVEADGIYRPLNFRSYISSVPGSASSAPSNTVVTWQFPLLLKYRARALAPNVRPLLEAGPSFRAASNLNDTSPSNHGITAGIGIEAHALRLRIAPAFRYTRWARDRSAANLVPPRSNPNQAEAMIGLSF